MQNTFKLFSRLMSILHQHIGLRNQALLVACQGGLCVSFPLSSNDFLHLFDLAQGRLESLCSVTSFMGEVDNGYSIGVGNLLQLLERHNAVFINGIQAAIAFSHCRYAENADQQHPHGQQTTDSKNTLSNCPISKPFTQTEPTLDHLPVTNRQSCGTPLAEHSVSIIRGSDLIS